jgi:hypothetical protein
MAWTQGRLRMCTMQLHLLTYCERVAWWDNTAKRGRRDEGWGQERGGPAWRGRAHRQGNTLCGAV